VTYQYDDDDTFPTPDMERCANCGYVFYAEEGFDNDDDDEPIVFL